MPTTFAVVPRSRRSADWIRARAPGTARDAGAPARSISARRPARSRPAGARRASPTSRHDAPGRRGAAKRGQPVAPTRVLDEDDGDGAVLAGVQDLVAELGVVEVLRRPERAPRIRLARLSRHQQDDLAEDVEARVVVVAERRRRDAVASEHHLARDVSVGREGEREEIRASSERPGRGAGRRHLDRRAGREPDTRQHLEALEESATVAGGTKAEPPELGLEVAGRPVGPGGARAAAFHAGIAQVPDPAEEASRLGNRLGGAGPARCSGNRPDDQGEKEAAGARPSAGGRCRGTPRRTCTHAVCRGRPRVPERGLPSRQSPGAGSRDTEAPRASGPWCP